MITVVLTYKNGEVEKFPSITRRNIMHSANMFILGEIETPWSVLQSVGFYGVSIEEAKYIRGMYPTLSDVKVASVISDMPYQPVKKLDFSHAIKEATD